MGFVEECAEGLGCSSLPAKSAVEPAAGASEVVRHLLWCRPRGCFWYRGRCAGRWELRVCEVEVTAMEVKGEEDVTGCHVQAAPPVA